MHSAEQQAHKVRCHPAIFCDMVSHMKTTVEIPGRLLADARHLAAREKTTLKALIQEGLRRVIEERKNNQPFKLRKVTFRGKGLHPDVAESSWSKIRDLSYEGRGA